MSKLIACCGVDCAECPAYIAFRDDNDVLRAETAVLWGRQLDAAVEPEYINCKGCQQDGLHLGYCAICKVRECCLQRGFDNCAHCSDYICDILQRGFDFMCDPLEMGTPDNLPARINLEKERRRLSKKPKTF
jgi:hypothetical protein